jgi:hypothetical protein
MVEMTAEAELEDELRRAEEEFAEGDFIELTIEELVRSGDELADGPSVRRPAASGS